MLHVTYLSKGSKCFFHCCMWFSFLVSCSYFLRPYLNIRLWISVFISVKVDELGTMIKKNKSRLYQDVCVPVFISSHSSPILDIDTLFFQCLWKWVLCAIYYTECSKYNEAQMLWAVAMVTEQFIYMSLLEIAWAGFLGHQAVFFLFFFKWDLPFNYRTKVQVF